MLSLSHRSYSPPPGHRWQSGERGSILTPSSANQNDVGIQGLPEAVPLLKRPSVRDACHPEFPERTFHTFMRHVDNATITHYLMPAGAGARDDREGYDYRF